jgi:hypothetical protein
LFASMVCIHIKTRSKLAPPFTTFRETAVVLNPFKPEPPPRSRFGFVGLFSECGRYGVLPSANSALVRESITIIDASGAATQRASWSVVAPA